MFSYGSFRSDEVGLYFMPVMAMPSTKRFCTKKKTTSNGSADNFVNDHSALKACVGYDME